MTQPTRFRFLGTSSTRSGWVEWGPFVIAIIVAAGLLFLLARTSPILSGPPPLRASDPSAFLRSEHSTDATSSSDSDNESDESDAAPNDSD